MSILNSKFDILRGWPNSSAVAEDWVVPTIGSTHDNLHEGHWVRLNPTIPSVMTCVSETRADKDSPLVINLNGLHHAMPLWGLIIEGQDSYSSSFSKRVTVLLGGGYIVRLWNSVGAQHADAAADNMFIAAGMAPGQPVGLLNGMIQTTGTVVAAELGDARELMVAGDLSPLGWCVRYDSANATCDIFVK